MANVSVFGLGKVGHTLACCLAAAGNSVIGYDPIAAVVDSVSDGTYESFEFGVPERLAVSGARLTATPSPDEAVLRSDISMVIVPTPSNALGGFSLRFVLEACENIGRALRKKKTPHCVALVSTVLPGASDRYIIPALEAAAGRRIGAGLSYCYNPSFVALGEVLRGFEQPDYVLIGQANAESGDPVEAVHRSMLRDDLPIVRMKPIEAEIAKIASNTHETMRVAFANMLFSLCSEVPDADVDVITGALGYRMGRRFFKGAVPYGGPCWPRDNRALAVFMDAVGVPSVMPRTIDVSNEEHGRYVLSKVLEATERGEAVGLLGLAYKSGTHVIDCSFGVNLARWLLEDGRRVVAWDPMAAAEAQSVLPEEVAFSKSPEECLRLSRVAVVINPMSELKAVNWSAASGVKVLDPWRCLDAAAVKQVGEYVAMGRGNGVAMSVWLATNDLEKRLRLLNS